MALISCTFTRTCWPAFCTLPSKMCATPSCFAICGKFSGALLKCCVEVREITFKSATLIKAIGPEMGISGCFDQLHVHAHGVTALLHAAFQNVGNAKLLGDLPQILRRALIVLGRSARDDLQIGDLGESGQNLVLDPIGEVGVRSIVTEVFKRKDGDRLAVDLRCRWSLLSLFDRFLRVQ
jgi:hypothetical protein